MPKQLSCGTLVVNARRELLLCHVTHTPKWDIPKGLLDPGENPLEAAMRELREEAGASFPRALFEDLGLHAYRPDKDLYLFKVTAPPEFDDLSQLVCTSFYFDTRLKKQVPEADGFRWAARGELEQLCWPRMGKLLTALDW
ncbi:MAG TPA: NUDIX hydrolase [Burkholderiaceae bacterium]